MLLVVMSAIWRGLGVKRSRVQIPASPTKISADQRPFEVETPSRKVKVRARFGHIVCTSCTSWPWSGRWRRFRVTSANSVRETGCLEIQSPANPSRFSDRMLLRRATKLLRLLVNPS
jgi:hypothetical protein